MTAETREDDTTWTEKMDEYTACDRYEELCSALEDLQHEFDYAAKLSPFFYYDWISTPDKPLSREAWEAFQKVNGTDQQWELWETFPDGNYCGRYFGEQRWLEVFRRLAASGFRVLEELQNHLKAHDCGADDVLLTMPPYDGHFAWLSLIHDTARLGTGLLHCSFTPWGVPPATDGDEWDTLLYDSWSSTESGLRIPDHPPCESLQMNLFALLPRPFASG